MEIAQEKRGAVFVLGPVGRLDTDSAADLELALQDLLATGGAHFVVDLAQINYVSSAGLRVLLMLAKSVEKKGSLRISGLNPQVQQVFDIAGFTKLFQIHPDRKAALREHPEAGVVEAEPVAAASEPAPRGASKERPAPAEPSAPPGTEAREAAPAKPAPASSEPAPAARREETPAPPPREAPQVAARETRPPPRPAAPPVEARESPPRPAPAPVESRESTPPPRAATAPVESRESTPPPRTATAPVEARESTPPPRTATAPLEAREAPPAAPAPSQPKVVAPTLAEHVAKLLAVGPATNTPLDPSIKVLGRHAAMLLGVKLDGAASASASAKSAAAPKASPAAPAKPEAEPDEKGGLLSRLFGKKKRSNL